MDIKKLTFVCLSILFISTTACAQSKGGRPSPEDRAKREGEQLTKELSLSNEQSNKANEILLEGAKKAKVIYDEAEGDRAVARKKMMVIREEQDKKLTAILTPEQQTKYLEYKKKKAEERKQRRENRGSRPE